MLAIAKPVGAKKTASIGKNCYLLKLKGGSSMKLIVWIIKTLLLGDADYHFIVASWIVITENCSAIKLWNKWGIVIYTYRSRHVYIRAGVIKDRSNYQQSAGNAHV